MTAVVRQLRSEDADASSDPMTGHPHIVVDHLSKSYGTGNGKVEALRDISLKIRHGAFVSVVGPSGCGKSTLMRCVAGLETPDAGGVIVDGRQINSPPDNLGMVFQRDVLLEWRSVLDNVLLLIEFRGQKRQDWIDRARELLEIFGLGAFRDGYPSELSGGMRQRVSICRAMLGDPEILLMDEPFAALDAFTRDDLNLELQTNTLRTKATTFFITHNIDEAIFLGDQVVVLDRRPGRLALVLDIDLPRPRPLSVRETREFADYRGEVRRTFEQLGILRRSL